MKITDIFVKEERTFSFEFFPPKDEISAVEMGINTGRLMKLAPSFVSVTYGAGGSTQGRTFDLVDFFQNNLGLNTMAHYTCVNASRERIKSDMEEMHEKNIENVMLLRGDPPKGSGELKPNPDGFNYGSDLISFVKDMGHFAIGAGAYPEKHTEAPDMDTDIENLKKKVDAGADFLVTQMFFKNEYYYDFMEAATKAGIKCRIIPGIIPITNFQQIQRFAELSGAHIPKEITNRMEPYKDKPQKVYQIGVELAIKQCRELLENGAPGLHFYTLNKSRAAVEIYESLAYSFIDIKHRIDRSLNSIY